MYTLKTTIQNPTGLHARPASDFVRCAKGFESTITVNKPSTGEQANAKSIIKVLGLAVGCGEEIELCADGADERVAVDSLYALIESRFGE